MSPSQRIGLARGWLSPFQKDLNWFSSSAICWVQKGSVPAGMRGQFNSAEALVEGGEERERERRKDRGKKRSKGGKEERERERGGQREGGTVWTLHSKSFL